MSGVLTLSTNDPMRRSIAINLAVNEPGSRVGNPHQDFNLQDLEGTQHSLKQYRGQVVLLAYFATF